MSEISITKSEKGSSWRYENEVNGITKCVRVEQVENGFVITISKYGYPKDVKDGKYIDERKVYISEENPLKDMASENKEEKGKDKGISEMKDLLSQFGDISF